MPTFRKITSADVASWANILEIDRSFVNELYSVFKGEEWEVGAAKAYLARMMQETKGFKVFKDGNAGESGANIGRGLIQLTHLDMYVGLQQYLEEKYPGKFDVLSPNRMDTVATDSFLRAESAKYFAKEKKLHTVTTVTAMMVRVIGAFSGLEETIKLGLKLEVGNEAAFLRKERAAFTQLMQKNLPILQSGINDFTVCGVKFDCGVAAVQQKLADLGFLGGGTAAVDGRYGDDTMNAVKKFQKQNGLASDGKVGPQTLSKINEVHRGKATNGPTPGEKEFNGRLPSDHVRYAAKRALAYGHQAILESAIVVEVATAASPLLAFGPLGWVGYAVAIGATHAGVCKVYQPFHRPL
jgi:hypothetical protein